MWGRLGCGLEVEVDGSAGEGLERTGGMARAVSTQYSDFRKQNGVLRRYSQATTITNAETDHEG